jgi:hypothetical protein
MNQCALRACAAGLLVLAVGAGKARADGSYPGETLSLSVAGASVAGTETNFVASGQDLDTSGYAGGFGLEVYVKNPAVDPTCATSYLGEESASITDPSETQIIFGQAETLSDGPFSVPFKALLNAGPVLLCAYSTWVTDTAASAQLTVDVAAAPAPPAPSSTGTTPTGTAPATTPPATLKPPSNSKAPRVTRAGQWLTCTKGLWTNEPTRYAFGWTVNGRADKHARSSRLRVTRALRAHRIRCAVTASNQAGAQTRASASFTVR